MKRLLYLFTAVLITAACNSTLQDETSPGVLNHVTIGVKPMDLSDLPAATKSQIIIDGTVKFAWSADDVVGIYPDRGAQAYFEMNSFAGEDQASFDGGGWALKAANKYSTYYPYDYDFSDPHAIPFTYSNQLQNGKNDYSHLNDYQHMANGAEVPQNGSCNFQMERAEAVVIFKLTLPMIATYKDLTVRVADGTDMVVSTMLNILEDQYSITPTLTSHTFSLGLQNITTTVENETVNFYAMMPPQNLSGKRIIISVNTVDGDCCQAEIDGKNMLNNHAYQYVATLTSDMGSLVESFGSESGNW